MCTLTQCMRCIWTLAFLASSMRLGTDYRTSHIWNEDQTVDFPSAARSSPTIWILEVWRLDLLSRLSNSQRANSQSFPWLLCHTSWGSPRASHCSRVSYSWRLDWFVVWMCDFQFLVYLARTLLSIASFSFLPFFSCPSHRGVRRSFGRCCCRSLLFSRWVFVFQSSSNATVACECLELKRLYAPSFQLSVGQASSCTVPEASYSMMNGSSFLVVGRCFFCSSNHYSFFHQTVRCRWHPAFSMLSAWQAHLGTASNALMDHTSILGYLVCSQIFSGQWSSTNSNW